MLKVPALWGCRDPEIGGYLKGDRFYRHLVTPRLVTSYAEISYAAMDFDCSR